MSDSAKVAHYKTAFGKAKTNLSPELLDKLAHINAWHAREDTFGDGVMSKLTITEFGTFVRPEDGKTHGRIVYEGIVTQGESLPVNALSCLMYVRPRHVQLSWHDARRLRRFHG